MEKRLKPREIWIDVISVINFRNFLLGTIPKEDLLDKKAGYIFSVPKTFTGNKT